LTRYFSRLLLCVFALVAVPLVGSAAQPPRFAVGGEPVDIAAESVEFNRKESTFTAKGKVELKEELDISIAELVLDGARVNQALLNLISNAIQASQAGGEVCVRTRSDNGEVVVEVSDSGCGIPNEDQGFDRNEFAKGLYPSPPDLTLGNVQREWNDAELYWIIKNGLKLTGMPAFGVTHDDNQVWGMVAFLGKLPNLQGKEYVAMVKGIEEQQEEGKTSDHHHSHTDE